uniref:Galectin n=1 Tax=Cynoglossus semilaevis TaxID=244447 RepID=A0A3P8V4X3_CYNSE
MLVSRTRQTFLKPSIPFAGTILGGLLPGEMVLVQGSVPVGADRFQVDLACGSSMKPRADVAFHFNPRFSGSPCVVCNTLQCERWGPEEIQHQNPLKSAHTFELVFLVLQDKFKVAVNGAHLLQYKQRVALERVDTILISGKVAVEVVGVVPSMSVSLQKRVIFLSVSRNRDLFRVPFSGFLGDGLRVGQSVSIRAETNHNAQSFCVNLCSSESSDIALHLNPRLKSRIFVRNSFLSDSWGSEETALDGFPFMAGQYFEMIVYCDSQHYGVAVNGDHILTYKHRVQDLRRINQVEVQGDVSLLDVKLH